jgi:hypothetical protein
MERDKLQRELYEEYMGLCPKESPEREIRTETVLGKRMWDIDKDGFLTGRTSLGKHKKWEKVEEAVCNRNDYDEYNYSRMFPDEWYRYQREPHLPPVKSCSCGIYAYFAEKWEMPENEEESVVSISKDLDLAMFLNRERYDGSFLSEFNTTRFFNNFFWMEEQMGEELFHNMYAYIRNDNKPNTVAFGFINAWGRIVEHHRGFRCQYAQVQRLILPCGTPEDIQEKLSRNYDCDISVLNKEGIEGIQKQHEREERQREAARMFEDRGWLKRPDIFVPEVKVSLDWKGRTRVEVSPSKYQYFSDLLDRNLITADEIKQNYKRAKPKE